MNKKLFHDNPWIVLAVMVLVMVTGVWIPFAVLCAVLFFGRLIWYRCTKNNLTHDRFHIRYGEQQRDFEKQLAAIPVYVPKRRPPTTLETLPPLQADEPITPPTEAEVVEKPTLLSGEVSLTMPPHVEAQGVYRQPGPDRIFYITKREVVDNPFFRVKEEGNRE